MAVEAEVVGRVEEDDEDLNHHTTQLQILYGTSLYILYPTSIAYMILNLLHSQ